MIIVSTYNETIGSKKFNEFLAKPFLVDMLYPINVNNSCEILFKGWCGNDMINWYKFNNDKSTLEFYSTYYQVKKDIPNSITYISSIPKTINDFINDMNRFGVDLYWTNYVDNNFEPNEYLQEKDIEKYYRDLLKIMNKSYELL
jgi:hypothetical protein